MKEPSKYTCPKCHSENIQTYRLVYTGGVTTTSSGTIGVGIGGGHLGVGAASSSGVNVSQLAETVAPPRKKSWIKKFFIHFFVFWFGGCFLCMPVLAAGDQSAGLVGAVDLICFVGALVWARWQANKIRRWNEDVYPKLLHHWNRSYICLRCGHRFVIED